MTITRSRTTDAPTDDTGRFDSLATPLARTVTGRSASYREARDLASSLRRSHTDSDAYAVFVLPLDGWYVKTASAMLAARASAT